MSADDKPYTPSTDDELVWALRERAQTDSPTHALMSQAADRIASLTAHDESVRAEARAEAFSAGVAQVPRRAEKAEAERDALAASAELAETKYLEIIASVKAERDQWKRNYQQVEGELHQMGARAVAAEAVIEKVGHVATSKSDVVNTVVRVETAHITQVLAEARIDPSAMLAEHDALKREMEARELHNFEADELADTLSAAIVAAIEWNKMHNGQPRYGDLNRILSAPVATLAERDARIRKQALLDAADEFAVMPHPYEGGVTGWLRARASHPRTDDAHETEGE